MPSKRFKESLEEMEEILSWETMGFPGLSMEGIPYVVPLIIWYFTIPAGRDTL
ncbi:MAG: hypothetical protein JXJ04_24345 [Spirochaetales bacterium]|nr:hypothetical protein [Spirochaetales bacterium]